ncbi:hypothetical protein P154DRAFT_559879 [Amniculicola lignicola CBS 123094]|uniref:Uncharacterized protein n=1 Tax=Amniculicola lignicola CBS 123094 TaxID=1392246 RepID=A0A6A5X1M9_9PLEO|nr:hypothetical protein P154DRAFT_559879 [Amniculicola lignicola CBS 123094]
MSRRKALPRNFLSLCQVITQPQTPPPNPTSSSNDDVSNGLPAGAKSGIGIGATVALVLIALSAFLLGRRISQVKRSSGITFDEAELDDTTTKSRNGDPAEPDGEGGKHCIGVVEQVAPVELDGGDIERGQSMDTVESSSRYRPNGTSSPVGEYT